MRVERVGLEDHGHVSVAGRHLVDDLVVDLDLTRGDVLEARQHAQGGRLAAAGGPDQDHELGVPNRKAEVIHGRRFGRELLGDVLVGDRRHGKILVDRTTNRREWRHAGSLALDRTGSHARDEVVDEERIQHGDWDRA